MRPRLHWRPGTVAVCLAGVGLVLTGCAGQPGPSATSSTTSRSAGGTGATGPASPSAPAPDTTGIPQGASPFSGRPGGADKPVLVVKLDNTPNAQPHAGLTAADIVYVEEVEFGLTRIAAVFSSSLPKTVGPVRSARISDIDLLAQFGKPAFAYSGAQHRMRPLLAAASIYDVSGDKGPAGYYRDPRRRAPYNFMGVPKALLARAPGASTAQDIGFVFSSTAPAGGRPTKSVTARYPDSSATFVWNSTLQSWDVVLNKRPARSAEGGTQHAATVVIQYVAQHDSGFGDKFGGKTPKLETVGTGTGLVLRNGRSYPVTWSRPAATGGTTFTTADGQQMPFAVGQEWVVLVNQATKAVLR